MLSVTSTRGAFIVALLRGKQRTRLTAFGGSMRPTIRSGDQLTIDPASVESLVVGEVILCVQQERLLIHRVVGLHPLSLKGDALDDGDGALRPEDVLGRVIRIESRTRYRGLRRQLTKIADKISLTLVGRGEI